MVKKVFQELDGKWWYIMNWRGHCIIRPVLECWDFKLRLWSLYFFLNLKHFEIAFKTKQRLNMRYWHYRWHPNLAAVSLHLMGKENEKLLGVAVGWVSKFSQTMDNDNILLSFWIYWTILKSVSSKTFIVMSEFIAI